MNDFIWFFGHREESRSGGATKRSRFKPLRPDVRRGEEGEGAGDVQARAGDWGIQNRPANFDGFVKSRHSGENRSPENS